MDIQEDIENVSGYTIGDITIIGNVKTISTTHKEHHNVIIFLTLGMFLDISMQVLKNKGKSRKEFVDIGGGNFIFYIEKSNADMISIIYKGEIIDSVDVKGFLRSVMESMNKFRQTYSIVIDDRPDDLTDSFLADYKYFSQYTQKHL